MKKHIFITGSTDGIGKLAAIKLAQDGHRLWLHGRSPAKLEKVIQEVQSASGNQDISGWTADFSDLVAVRDMAAQIKSELSHLDVLINNAGIFKSPAAQNAQGLDIRMTVNYVAPYVLTDALLPLVQKSKTGRIINLSSAAQAPVQSDVLSGQIHRSESETYAQSKLALTMWSFHLAQALSDTAVIAVNPGSLLNTRMVQEAYGRHWAPAGKGANILYDLAVSADYEGVTGKYFDNDAGSFGQAHPDAYDAAKVQQLLLETKALLPS